MAIRLSDIYPSGCDEQKYVDDIVLLNETYGWGLNIDYDSTWEEVHAALGTIDAIKTQIITSDTVIGITPLQLPVVSTGEAVLDIAAPKLVTPSSVASSAAFNAQTTSDSVVVVIT